MPNEVELLANPDDVTPGWLDRVLARAGLAEAGALEGFDAASVGTGKVGEVVRFSLRWREGHEGPRSVIVKFASRNETSRQAGVMTQTYVREVSFYRSLAAGVALKVPDCYGVAFAPETGHCTLVLEDLAPARAGDQLTGCSVAQAADAMRALAGLHAPFWDQPELAKQPWLAGSGVDAVGGLAQIYDMFVDAFTARFAARLAPEVVDAARRLKGRVGAWLDFDVGPHTLLHGDYRVENLLFGEPGAAFPVAVVDWQTIQLGPGLRDVSYFIGAGLREAERRTHELELVRVYLDAMASRGVALDPDVSWDRYCVHAFAGLHMAVVAGSLVGADPRSDEMFCVMAERHALQALELRAFERIAA